MRSRVVPFAKTRVCGPTQLVDQAGEGTTANVQQCTSTSRETRYAGGGFLAFALGVMLSPDTLILLGNTLGREGYAALSGLLIAGGLHVLTAWTYGRLDLHPTASVGESRCLADAYGPLVATVLPLCARVVYTVAATTGILAIAGYVWNKVFVYWFPNLGFSFCLLGMVVGLSLAGPRVATLAQLSYVMLALGGLLCLSAMGLLGWEGFPVRVRGDGLVLCGDGAESARGPRPLRGV